MSSPEEFARRLREQKRRDREERERAKALQRKPAFSPALRRSYQMRRRFARAEREQRAAAAEAMRSPVRSSSRSLGLAHDDATAPPNEQPVVGVFRKLSQRISRRSSSALRLAAALTGALTRTDSAESGASDAAALESARLASPFDVVIVGGGFAGAFCAFQLRQENPALRLAIVERRAAAGGRLLSSDADDPHSVDLDSMLLDMHADAAVAEAAEAVGCELLPAPQRDAENLYFLSGERARRKSFRLPSGRSCDEMLSHCLEHFRSAAPADAALPPTESQEMRALSLPAFLRKYGASQSELDAFFLFAGAEPDPDAAASGFFAAREADDAADTRVVKQGFRELVRRLAQASGAEMLLGCFAVGMQRAAGGEDDAKSTPRMHFGGDDDDDDDVARGGAAAEDEACALVQVDFRRCGAALSGRGERGERGSGVSGAGGAFECVRARRVVLAVPPEAAVRLARRASSLISKQRMLFLQHAVKPSPVFTCALVWDPAAAPGPHWWRALGFRCGKSTTDLEIQTLRYADGSDALVAQSSGRFAEFWDREFRADWRAAAREVFEQAKTLHGDEAEGAPEPDWSATAFRFWKGGAHSWRVGADVSEARAEVCHGSEDPDGQTVFVVGDAFSGAQGRAGGCAETVRMALPFLL